MNEQIGVVTLDNMHVSDRGVTEERSVLHDVNVSVRDTRRVICRIRHVHQRRESQARSVRCNNLEIRDLRLERRNVGAVIVAATASRRGYRCEEKGILAYLIYSRTHKMNIRMRCRIVIEEVKTYA